MNKTCENCIYLKQRSSMSVYMNGLSDLNIHCSFMKDGIYQKGMLDSLDYSCKEFIEGKNDWNVLSKMEKEGFVIK